jgi:hypothetical protein
MENFERSLVRPAQARQRRGVRGSGGEDRAAPGRRVAEPGAGESAANADGRAVQEVAAGDGAVHAEATVFEVV